MDKTTDALLFLARFQERGLARHVDNLRKEAGLRFWQFGAGWRSYAKLVLPEAERQLAELRRHIASLEHADDA